MRCSIVQVKYIFLGSATEHSQGRSQGETTWARAHFLRNEEPLLKRVREPFRGAKGPLGPFNSMSKPFVGVMGPLVSFRGSFDVFRGPW